MIEIYDRFDKIKDTFYTYTIEEAKAVTRNTIGNNTDYYHYKIYELILRDVNIWE
jgi:hypothetical protein